MLPNSDVTHRSTKKSTTKKLKRKNENVGDANNKNRRSRRRDSKSLVLAFLASFVFFSMIYFLFIRPKISYNGLDSERYARGKALRNAALLSMSQGDSNGIDSSSNGSSNKKVRGGKQLKQKEYIGGMRYLDPRQLPPLPGEPSEPYDGHGKKHGFRGDGDDEWQADSKSNPRQLPAPNVDYTKHTYQYPEVMYEPPNDGTYPPLQKMSTIFETWGQDDLDSPPDTIVEVLQHFDFQDPDQLKAAIKYRDLELPFKVYNVPEVVAAGSKWTDEYVSSHFDGHNTDGLPPSRGQCSQSVDHFFAFHRPDRWDTDLLGSPPSVDINWTYKKWAQHAVYADKVALPINKKHYYWQSGVPREERLHGQKHWTFVSRDLPSFSNPEPTFFGFNPPRQKGIQCRFGERGVTAATHYDGGRNMIAMMVGAKRYVLSPPMACPKLGIVTSYKHPSYRHSMLNFGRVTLLDGEGDSGVEMSAREKEWLKISADAPTLSTVLKAGEVLYVPSHWFHYIVSLQKSAQCNTRSGIHEEGNPNFGGVQDVLDCIGNEDE